MRRRLIVATVLAASLPWLVACSGEDEDAPPAGTSDSSNQSDSDDVEAFDDAAADKHAASVDVCSLLTPAEGADLARASQLSQGVGDASSVYEMTTTPQVYDDNGGRPRSGCEFYFNLDNSGQVTVVVEVSSAYLWSLYSDDSAAEKLPDLGDEAFKIRDSVVVRVGDLQMEATQNSATGHWTEAMYKHMAPRL